jgi:Bifunctional PLP-dependent enzyme with beta-cystathionase and maltose regulon repressor activities
MSKVKINKSRRRLIQSAGSIPIAVSAPNVLSNHHHREQTNPVVSNLDEIYPRWKTDSAKWDLQTKRFPGQKIHAAMGIADLDFKTAPEITKAIAERVLHENWG